MSKRSSKSNSVSVVARSMLFNLLFFLFSSIYGPFSILCLILPTWFAFGFLWIWVYVTLFLLKICCNVRLTINGKIEYPKSGKLLVASSHKNDIDPFILFWLLREPVFVVKRRVMWYPFVGLIFLRLNMIHIDINDRIASLRRVCSIALHNKIRWKTLVIFPEGSRVTDGMQHPGYGRSISVIYGKLSMPTLPIFIDYRGSCCKTLFGIKKPGNILVRIGANIPAGLERNEFMKKIVEGIS